MVLLFPWCVLIKSLMAWGSISLSAILIPSFTCCMIIWALCSYERLWWGFTPDWFSVKNAGFASFPISWYKAPVLTNWAFAPILFAASAAKFEICMECWNVPGQISESCLSTGELMSDNSTKVTLEMKPNVFSSK